jgi:hypothetical protein
MKIEHSILEPIEKKFKDIRNVRQTNKTIKSYMKLYENVNLKNFTKY